MDLKERIEAFSSFGIILRNSMTGTGEHSSELINLIENQHLKNPWFTPGNIRMAVEAIADELTKLNLTEWASAYPLLNVESDPLTIAVIMAGNIPAVGFHDMLSVLISGNRLVAKTSTKDNDLLPFFGEILCEINPGFRDMICFTDDNLRDFDAVIATGSDNSARYFEYYFGKYPHIIRKNRNSVAIIEGSETFEEVAGLGKDIFSYFGLGCRNVSRLFIPYGFYIKSLVSGWEQYEVLTNHSKYASNYDFNKAVYLVNKEQFTDTGYLLMKQDARLASPVAVLYYDFYSSVIELNEQIESQKDKIQCIVGKGHTPFGSSQSPHLWDYADGIDTLGFLSEKKMTRDIVK